jgi:hypothetical protein
MPSRIEELAQANLKPVPVNPCVAWDQMVSERMATFGEDRPTAVDRLLAGGASDVWLKCQGWDAAQPKILSDGTRSGNWKNQGNGVVRRVPRQP